MEVSKSHGRVRELETNLAKLNSDRVKTNQEFETREQERTDFMDAIKVAVAKLCLLSDYSASRLCLLSCCFSKGWVGVFSSCSVSTAAGASRHHARYTDGKRGNAGADVQCALPFTYKNVKHTDCVGTGYGGYGWCSLDTTYAGNWGR